MLSANAPHLPTLTLQEPAFSVRRGGGGGNNNNNNKSSQVPRTRELILDQKLRRLVPLVHVHSKSTSFQHSQNEPMLDNGLKRRAKTISCSVTLAQTSRTKVRQPSISLVTNTTAGVLYLTPRSYSLELGCFRIICLWRVSWTDSWNSRISA